jgi:uncharacterized protein
MRSRHWLWLLLAVPMALGFWRLRLDVEVMNLLPNDFAVVRGLKLYQTNFANARELIITIDAREPGDGENAAHIIALALRAATNLTTQVTWQPLWLESPGQSAELVAFAWLNQPPHLFGELTNRLAATNLPHVLREAREALTTSFSPQEFARRGYDPFNLTQLPETAGQADAFGDGSDYFSSADGTFRVVFADAQPDINNYKRCAVWLNEVKDVVTNALATNLLTDRVRVRYTGRPAFVTEISKGMERDMTSSVAGTMLIVAALFWWAHRRWLPLVWVLVLLTLILAGTMALGGLIFGTLSVISMGFAAILLGLAVDYGLVIYQESRAAPHKSAREIRHELLGSILWSAVTTAGAFAILNLGGLPGLGQLGTLVAIGVTLAAVVMLYAYLPPLLRKTGAPIEPSPTTWRKPRTKLALATTLLLVITAVAVLSWRFPGFDHSADALRLQHSEAYAAADQIKHKLKRTQEPVWVLASARDEAEMVTKLARARTALEAAQAKGEVASFLLPDAFWPRPHFQRLNRPIVAGLAARTEELRQATLSAGFTSNSFALTENLLSVWRKAAEQNTVFWPTNENSRWVLDQFIARNNGSNWLALGLIYRNTNQPAAEATAPLIQMANELARDGIYISGWEMLGQSIFAYVTEHFPRVFAPMCVLLFASLALAFRRWQEMLLSLATLLFSGMLLWTVMGAAGWSWNLMNLMAIPLLLGSGVDYSIHMQLALRRHEGDVSGVRRTVGRALFVCGATTVAGFGSLAWSSNAGMASLGKVCAAGIACCMFTSICLLPTWWHALTKKK